MQLLVRLLWPRSGSAFIRLSLTRFLNALPILIPLFRSLSPFQKPKELARSVTKGITAQLDIIGGKLVGL